LLPIAAELSLPFPPCIDSISFELLVLTSAMSFPTQAAARCCRQLSGSVRPSSLRIATSYTARRTPISRRWESTEAAAAAPSNPKIAQIVDQISTLTLLETADLVSSLKVCWPDPLIRKHTSTLRQLRRFPRILPLDSLLIIPRLTLLLSDPPEHPRSPRRRLRHGPRRRCPRSRRTR
jgi:hypothetical protein